MSLDRSTEILCERLKSAKEPEEVFGALEEGPVKTQIADLRVLFKGFLLRVHPDQNPNLKDANEYVLRLTTFRKVAETCLEAGTYGKPRKPKLDAVLHSRLGAYVVLEEFRSGEVASLLLAETEAKKRCILKIVRNPSDNDLLDNEARVLTGLHSKVDSKAEFFRQYLPNLLDSFPMIEGGRHRRVNVFDVADGFYSLAEIRAAYPEGLDTRDVAWMMRRTLEVLGWVHANGIVHGAILPEHLLVHPIDHGAKLIGWSYSVPSGRKLLAMSVLRKGMYPTSVTDRKPATPVLDVQLAAETAIFLSSDEKGKLRSDVPPEVATFLSACRAGKIKDGWEAYRDYSEVLTKSYGKRKYRAFAMPRV